MVRMQPFKAGIMKILASDPVPVIPAALHNLWGSTSRRIDGAAMARPLRRGLFNRIGLVVGEPIAPEVVTPRGPSGAGAGPAGRAQPLNRNGVNGRIAAPSDIARQT